MMCFEPRKCQVAQSRKKYQFGVCVCMYVCVCVVVVVVVVVVGDVILLYPWLLLYVFTEKIRRL